MSNKSILTIQNVSFSYGSTPVLKNFSLDVKERDIISLIGPSGFGKTTLLQLIAGDLKPETGTITKIGLWRRVFQKSSLFPWLTVEENIKLGLRGVDSTNTLNFDTIISILDLGRVLKNYPRELSGGQGQRTEIARALIGKPDGLLMDEPFSSLDYLIRHQTRNYLTEILKEYPMTMLLVTHDIPEAVAFTHKTYLMQGQPASRLKEYFNDGDPKELTEKIWNDLEIRNE